MALAIGGALYSGKIGNKVHLRNGTVRAFAVPTNPNTAAQAATRAMMASFSTVYRTFTVLQQEAWSDAAKAYPRTNRVGDTYVLAGITMYLACVIIAQLVQDTWPSVLLPTGDTPPVPQTVSNSALIRLNVGVNTLVGIFSLQPETAEYMLIYATAPLSNGITFTRKSRYRLIAIVNKNEFVATDIDLKPAYLAKFASMPLVNQRVFVQAFMIVDTEFVKRPAGKAFGTA